MKYLKTYKLFESSSEDIIRFLRDIFVELEDIGFEINFFAKNRHNGSDIDPFIEIHIEDKRKSYGRKTGFKIEDIYENISTAVNYMDENGYSLDSATATGSSYSGRFYIDLANNIKFYEEGLCDDLFDEEIQTIKLVFESNEVA